MEYFGLTDKGRVRPTNQDIFQIEAREDNRTALLVVCDGMGGARGGREASVSACDVIEHSSMSSTPSACPATRKSF